MFKIQTYLKKEWLSDSNSWLAKAPPEPTQFMCIHCNGTKPLRLSNMGIQAFKSHAESPNTQVSDLQFKSKIRILFFFFKKKSLGGAVGWALACESICFCC